MPILYVIIVLLVVGFLLWLANTKIPMQPTIKLLLNIFVIALVIIWLMKVTGIWAWLLSAHV